MPRPPHKQGTAYAGRVQASSWASSLHACDETALERPGRPSRTALARLRHAAFEAPRYAVNQLLGGPPLLALDDRFALGGAAQEGAAGLRARRIDRAPAVLALEPHGERDASPIQQQHVTSIADELGHSRCCVPQTVIVRSADAHVAGAVAMAASSTVGAAHGCRCVAHAGCRSKSAIQSTDQRARAVASFDLIDALPGFSRRRRPIGSGRTRASTGYSLASIAGRKRPEAPRGAVDGVVFAPFVHQFLRLPPEDFGLGPLRATRELLPAHRRVRVGSNDPLVRA